MFPHTGTGLLRLGLKTKWQPSTECQGSGRMYCYSGYPFPRKVFGISKLHFPAGIPQQQGDGSVCPSEKTRQPYGCLSLFLLCLPEKKPVSDRCCPVFRRISRLFVLAVRKSEGLMNAATFPVFGQGQPIRFRTVSADPVRGARPWMRVGTVCFSERIRPTLPEVPAQM